MGYFAGAGAEHRVHQGAGGAVRPSNIGLGQGGLSGQGEVCHGLL